MSTLVKFAKAELRAAGLFDDDADYNGDIGASVCALMETFCAYGHSGGSAAITLSLFAKLADHKPISPLTGEDDEWREMPSEDRHALFQNVRCSTVFKKENIAWDLADKQRPIKFPYTVA